MACSSTNPTWVSVLKTERGPSKAEVWNKLIWSDVYSEFRPSRIWKVIKQSSSIVVAQNVTNSKEAGRIYRKWRKQLFSF